MGIEIKITEKHCFQKKFKPTGKPLSEFQEAVEITLSCKIILLLSNVTYCKTGNIQMHDFFPLVPFAQV